MVTAILVCLTALFFLIAGICIALFLVRKELLRIIAETQSSFMGKIFEERKITDKQMEGLRRPSFDDSLSELITEYKKWMTKAMEQNQTHSAPVPPTE